MSELVLENEIAQIGFDYSGLENSVAVKAQIAASNIKLRLKRTVEDIIEIGRELKEIKAVLPHGKFLPWIEKEFEMSRETADNFISVHKRFGDKLVNFTNLKPSILYALAAPSTPDSVVDKAIAVSEAGEKITVDWVKREKEMLEAIKREKENAQKYKDLWHDSLKGEEVQRELAKQLQEQAGKPVERITEVVIEKIPADYETLKKSIADYQERIAADNYAREKLIEEQERAIAEAKKAQYKADKAARERDEQAIAERDRRIREQDREINEREKRLKGLQDAYASHSDKDKQLKVHLEHYENLRMASVNFWANFSGFGEPVDIDVEKRKASELPNMLRGIAASIDIFLGNTVAIENKV